MNGSESKGQGSTFKRSIVSTLAALPLLCTFLAQDATAVPCCSAVQVTNFGPNIKSHTEAVEYVTDTTVVNLANGWIHQYKPINHGNTDMFTPQGYEKKASSMDNGLIKSGSDGDGGCPATSFSNMGSSNAKPIAKAWKDAGGRVAVTIEAQWLEKLRPLNGWKK